MTVGPVASTGTRHPDPANGRLAGFTVAVTAQRRAEELVAMLRRTGAEVCRAPALRIVPLSDDQELAEASHSLLGHPPDIVVATTGVGFRGWLEACETLGLAQALIRGLATARVLARGPKAKGAVRAAGLREEWSPPSESSDELLGYLLDRGVAGARIAVQLHGEPLPDFCRALRHAGAQVVPVPVYRWTAPADLAALDRLIEDVRQGAVDAVTFTSAPAAAGLLNRANEIGVAESLVRRLRTSRPFACCVGPVTAGPLQAQGIPTSWPEWGRIGAMVRHLADELPRRTPTVKAAGHELTIRARAVRVDDTVHRLTPRLGRLLGALADRPGQVCDRVELLDALDGESAPHAVETAVARLRVALGGPRHRRDRGQARLPTRGRTVGRAVTIMTSSPSLRASRVVAPTLLVAAHGTRDPAGRTAMAALARRAGRFVGASTRIGFADVAEPDVGSVAAATDTPLIVVPAFLASGFHVRIDVPRQLRAAGRADATVTPALDHDPSVADALRLRLREAGHRPREPVVLAAAGSSRPEARVAALRAAEVLGRQLRTPVEVGYVASATPTVAEAVRRVRAHHGGRVCVASWLLAPGLFHRRLADSGADVVTAPLCDGGESDFGLAKAVALRYLMARARIEDGPGGLRSHASGTARGGWEHYADG